MFANNTLPLPTTFAREHQPLRLTAEASRPQPQGRCHFEHDPNTGYRCSCQTFQHNRSTPGNVCDCGHYACYHSALSTETAHGSDRAAVALEERIRRIESEVEKSRQRQDRQLDQERQIWGGALRDALTPVHRREQDIDARIRALEKAAAGAYHESLVTRNGLYATEESLASINQRLSQCETVVYRKRKGRAMSNEKDTISPSSEDMSYWSDADSNLSTRQGRRAPLSSVTTNPTTSVSPSRPREQTASTVQKEISEEPRSSGFLAIDITRRLNRARIDASPRRSQGLSHDQAILNGQLNAQGLPSPPHVDQTARPEIPIFFKGTNPNDFESRLPKKRKQHERGTSTVPAVA